MIQKRYREIYDIRTTENNVVKYKAIKRIQQTL